MKPYRVLIFILLTFLVLGLLGFVFPKQGINTFVKLKFIHPSTLLEKDTTTKIKLDEYLNIVFNNYQQDRIATIADSMQIYIDFQQKNPAAIHYPDNNDTYFDPLFESLDSAKQNAEVIRIVHYGDSQIEGDRISGYLREQLQKRFGGMGFGMIPAIQIIPSMGVYQNYSGSLVRHAMWGEEVPRASNRRYGPMAQMVKVYDQGSVSVYPSRQAYELGKKFSMVRLIFGNNQAPFSASLSAQGVSYGEKTTNDSITGVQIFTWKLSEPSSKATININGTAEIYGITFDGDFGVTVDNIPMRGSAGTVFTAIDKHHLTQCYKLLSAKMLILQYGGNVMPAVTGMKSIDWYIVAIEKEITFLKDTNPQSVILFIGPSDMSRNIDGQMRTWPYLKEMNEALKNVSLRNGIAYWDMFHAMGGENSMPEWVKTYPPLASTDYIHFTQLGAKTIAEMIYLAIINDYSAYKLRKKIEFIEKDTIFKKPI